MVERLELLTNKISEGKLEKKKNTSSSVESTLLCQTVGLHSSYAIITVRLHTSYLIINRNRGMRFGPGLQELVDRMLAWYVSLQEC